MSRKAVYARTSDSHPMLSILREKGLFQGLQGPQGSAGAPLSAPLNIQNRPIVGFFIENVKLNRRPVREALVTYASGMFQAPQQPEPPKKTCPQCGGEVPSGAKFCPYCGAALQAQAQKGESLYRDISVKIDV